jgi:putative hydrolase of the HAD superfamily
VTARSTRAGTQVGGVLLDADDTLYDTRAAMHAAGSAAAAALWPGADPERVRRAGVRFRDDPGGHFHAYARGEVEFDAMRRARVADLARWMGQPVEDGLWAAFEAVYEPAFLAAMAPFEDVRPAVTALRAAGLAVGVLTNSSEAYTGHKMRAAGLDGLFDVVCTRDTLGFGKPDPRAFREACRRLRTPDRGTLYVGDDLETDSLAAADAGMPAAWLVRDGAPDPDGVRRAGARGIPVVGSLADVVALLWP